MSNAHDRETHAQRVISRKLPNSFELTTIYKREWQTNQFVTENISPNIVLTNIARRTL